MRFKKFEWMENPDGYYENANFQKLVMGKVAYECGRPLQETSYFFDEEYDLYTPFVECLEAIGDSLHCTFEEWGCEDEFIIKCRQLDIYSNLLKEYKKYFGRKKAEEIDAVMISKLVEMNNISICMSCNTITNKKGILIAFKVHIYEQFDHYCDTVYGLYCLKKSCEAAINFMRNEFKKANIRKKVAA